MPLIFAPDADPSQPGVITSGTGLRPTTNGYANYKTLVPVNGGFGWTIPAVPLTMYGHNFSNTGRLIVGTASKLYQLGINTGPVYTVTDVSRGLGSYTGLGAVATDEG